MFFFQWYSKVVSALVLSALSLAACMSHATENDVRHLANAAAKSAPTVKICHYEFNSTVYAAQQAWSDEYDKIKNMAFFYLQTPQITTWQKIDEPTVDEVSLPIEVHVNANYTVWGIKLLKSSGSSALDQKIQRSYKDLRVETKKGFWWGPTLKFKDEIHLKRLRCQDFL